MFLRVIQINSNKSFSIKASKQQNISLEIFNRRANFYDSNFNKLTYCKKIKKAIIFPNKVNFKVARKIAKNFPKKKLKNLYELNKPFIIPVDNIIENKNILYFDDKLRFSDDCSKPVHLLGHLNSEDEGVSGLEFALNEFLDEKKYILNLNYLTNAKNKILNDKNFNLNSSGNFNDGVVLTINSSMQYILNKIGQEYIKKGAGIVLNANTGEILAVSSFPLFNPNNINASLKDEQQPLFNRAVENHPVGSIFKIVTAAAALKNNTNPNEQFNCKGFFKFNDVKFKCHKTSGHKELDMPNAMKHSCNPYFINLGLKLGNSEMLNTAQNFGFSREIVLCDNFKIKPATLPNFNMSSGELANFSFGQGKLKTSIFHIAQMLSAVVNNGYSVVPTLVKGEILNGKFENSNKITKFHALDSKTAKLLKQMLIYSIKNTPADPQIFTCGGKSSTAQTGEFFENGQEKLSTWFCSFSSFNTHNIVSVLFKEEGKFGMQDLGPCSKILNSYFYELLKQKQL